MKKLLLLSLFLSFNSFGDTFLCSLRHSKEVLRKARNHSSYDKNRHCTVSCMLSLKCNPKEVLSGGYLKEVKDFWGPGDADWEDIEADRYGVNLVRHKRARNEKECLQQCDAVY